jgi:hypothetical protein
MTPARAAAALRAPSSDVAADRLARVTATNPSAAPAAMRPSSSHVICIAPSPQCRPTPQIAASISPAPTRAIFAASRSGSDLPATSVLSAVVRSISASFAAPCQSMPIDCCRACLKRRRGRVRRTGSQLVPQPMPASRCDVQRILVDAKVLHPANGNAASRYTLRHRERVGCCASADGQQNSP